MFEERLHLLTLSQVHNGTWQASSESYYERLFIEQQQQAQLKPYDDFFAEKRTRRNVVCLIFALLQSTNKKARYVSTSCRMKTLWLKSSQRMNTKLQKIIIIIIIISIICIIVKKCVSF